MPDSPNAGRRGLLKTSIGFALASLGTPFHFQARAQGKDFPSRPIRLIVPFNPGSGTDTGARLFGSVLGELTGQSVIVENKAGANGIIAAQALLNSPADGYSMFYSSNSTLSTNAALFKDLPYDPLTDLAPITLMSGQYCTIVVPADSPYQTLADLVSDARARQDVLNHGAGSPTYGLWAAWLNDLAKIRTTNIFYKGAGEVINALLGKQVAYSLLDSANSATLVNAGRLRALVFTGPQRLPQMPATPTSAQAGFPDFKALAWTGIAISAQTPAPLRQQIEALSLTAAANKKIQDYNKKNNSLSLPPGPIAMRQFQVDEITRWKRLVAETGIAIQ